MLPSMLCGTNVSPHENTTYRAQEQEKTSRETFQALQTQIEGLPRRDHGTIYTGRDISPDSRSRVDQGTTASHQYERRV